MNASPGDTPDRHADADAHPSHCDNCATALHGGYCHACGQSAHNPLKNFGHAVEDVFESFWHLDGKIFRTLRDLFVPGRVAANYLGGQRVRYMPPLRLFVILTLFAFFVGRLTLGTSLVTLKDDPFADLQTVEQVEQVRDEALARLDRAAATLESVAGAEEGLAGIKDGKANVRTQAGRRIAELGGDPDTAATEAALEAADGVACPGGDCALSPGDQIAIDWLPGFANRWLNARAEKGRDNIEAMRRNPGLLAQSFLGAMPTALFFLMPVFALLLKLAYLGSGRGYLEHLVVALYSHCWLMLVLLASFLAASLPFGGGFMQWTLVALWLWTWAYLFLMQRRVYGGGLFPNLLRHVLIGGIYVWMVLSATLLALIAGLTS